MKTSHVQCKSRVSQPRALVALFILAIVGMGFAVGGCGQTNTSTLPNGAAVDTVLYGVEVDGKWGYIDKTGTMVIPAKYDAAYSSRRAWPLCRCPRRKATSTRPGP
jgi:hypothetical protein